jgi:UDP-N-acetylglucosamine:LPS N-acetylglucosamine transferase
MAGILEDLLTQPGRLESLRAACRASARPDAASRVARITLEGIRRRG